MGSSENEVDRQDGEMPQENVQMTGSVNEGEFDNNTPTEPSHDQRKHVKHTMRARRYRMFSNFSSDRDMPHTTTSF